MPFVSPLQKQKYKEYTKHCVWRKLQMVATSLLPTLETSKAKERIRIYYMRI